MLDLQLIGILVGFAAADSLNPFTVAAQAYLLSTPKPMGRSLAFLGGTFVTYFVGGIALLLGWQVLIQRVLPLIPVWGLGAGEILLGIILGVAAWYTAKQAKAGKPFTPPKDLSIKATLVFAVVSTASDLPTAAPYFAAVNRIAALEAGWGQELLLIAGYVLIYCLPLIILVVIRELLSAERSERIFGKMRAAIDWAFAKLLPPLIGLGAVALLIDGGRRLSNVLG